MANNRLARGLLWLLFLGPFFFLSYGLANQYAARVDAASGVGSLVFAWERHIPLWPWTIIPYWSIDLLYGLAFLCCRNWRATNRLALRLLSAQLICVTCFFLWPLRFAFDRPAVAGVSGLLFAALTSFDLPYNQAPSLHMALLVIIWRQFATFTSVRAGRWLIHAWAILIAISVLTTWQHHFIDVPTGLTTGLFCLWLWPEEGNSPLRKATVRRPALALRYFFAAALFFIAAIVLGGICLLLSWPALALALVAFNYAWAGAAGFQKEGGRQTLAAQWLFAPYTLGAWINSRLWTRRFPDPSPIGDGIWLGRLPTTRQFAVWAKERGGGAASGKTADGSTASGKIADDKTAGGKTALFDLTAELPAPRLPAEAIYEAMPCLDLVPVPASSQSAGNLTEAVQRLAALKGAHPDCEIWVACALGMSRSASVVAAWLCSATEKSTVLDAVKQIQQARRQIIINPDSIACLEEFCEGPFRHDQQLVG